MNGDHESLIALLSRLKLTAVRDQLDRLLDEATRRELNLREAWACLCEAEVARQDPQRIQRAMSIAHFPWVRTPQGFDFEAQPARAPRQRRALALGREAIRQGYPAGGTAQPLGQAEAPDRR